MRKVNFDSLTNYKAPDTWLDKAAAIPASCERKRTAVPLYRIAAVASIMLVSVIGLLVFLFLGNGKAPIAVSDKGIAVNDDATDCVVGETTKTGAPVPRETISVLSTDAQGNTVITYVEATEPQATGTHPTDSRTLPSESALSPTSAPSPTAPRATGNAVPSTCPPSTAAAVSDAPATDSPPLPETDPPLTDCRITVTTGYPSPAGEMQLIETGEPIVFCRMYDAAGNLVGSSSLFAEEKRATVVSINPDDTFVVTYDPLEKGLPITRGRYTYVMVDYYLGTELCRGSIEY